MQASGMWVSLT